MTTKECLEQKVNECTVYRRCRKHRDVFYVWDETDKVVEEFCKGLSFLQERGIHSIAVNGFTQAKHVLQDIRRENEGEIYVLLIGTSDDMYISPRMSNKEILEFARIVADARRLDMGMAQRDYSSGCVEWHVEKAGVKAIAVLLMHAAFAEFPLYPSQNAPSGRPQVYGIRCEEYNAIRENLCEYFLAQLEWQLEKTEYSKEDCEIWFEVERNIEEITARCFQPEYLPITGYDDLKNQMKKEFYYLPKKYLKKIILKTDQYMESNLKLREILFTLQGEKQGTLWAEWLRREVESEEVPIYCREVIEQNKQIIEETLASNFSLQDFCTLAQQLERYKSELLTEKKKKNVELKEMLERKVCFEKSGIKDFYEGLGFYFTGWRDYIKICAKGAFWENIAQLVFEKQSVNQKKLDALEESRDMLENSKIRIWKLRSLSGRKEAEGFRIFEQKELHEKIKRIWRRDRFCREDVEQMIMDVDAEYENTKENHARKECHPQIHLIYHESLNKIEVPESSCFKWFKHRVSYIPESLIWELRIYTDFGGKRYD